MLFVNEYLVDNILNKPELICLHTFKWFQQFYLTHRWDSNKYYHTESVNLGVINGNQEVFHIP